MLRRFTARSTFRLCERTIASTPVHSVRLTMPRVSTSKASMPTNKRFQSTANDNKTAQIKVDKPELMIAFTCKKCKTRSSHVMSKQAYTSGTVLITCPGCQNRHLIADHLKIFSDDRITIQDILSAKGESVSQSTDDLVFDEIPEKLKKLIGHHAKDSPENTTQEIVESDEQRSLPEGEK